MALPLQVDWNLIQALYLKGLTPKTIEAQTGIKADTVSNRAHRYKWRESLLKSRTLVKVEVEGLPEPSPLSRQSERARNGLARTLERFVDKIETLQPKTAKAALKASGELESVVRNCKTVFGWSEGQHTPAVRINILGSATIATEQDKARAIDLPPTSGQGTLPPSD